MSHEYHPDIHENGLQDNCHRCREHADYPLRSLDNNMVKLLVQRIENKWKGRTETEGIAMMNLNESILQARRLLEIGFEI